jgi:hypothetical protein
VVTILDQLKHCLIHLDEFVLSERLLLLPVDQRLLNLGLKKVWLDSIDNLKTKVANKESYVKEESAIDNFCVFSDRQVNLQFSIS